MRVDHAADLQPAHNPTSTKRRARPVHVAAVMDTIGGIQATMTIATDTGGFQQPLDWAEPFGQIIAFGIEGIGSYGAALTSFVRRKDYRTVEVNRPDRRCAAWSANPTSSTRTCAPATSTPQKTASNTRSGR